MELLLNRKEIRWVLHYLVRWRGHTSADDEWLRAEELVHCPERVAEYDAAAPRRWRARRDRRRVCCSSRGDGSDCPPGGPTASRVPVGDDGQGAGWCCSGGVVHPVPLAGAGLGPGQGGLG